MAYNLDYPSADACLPAVYKITIFVLLNTNQ